MEGKKLFPIGEVSKMFHISVSSLRHYENIGLLKPEYISPDSGYRYYGTEQFEALNTIRYLRELDMPLSEIEDFLKNKDVSKIEEKLYQQRETVLQKIQNLKRVEKKIDRRLDMLADSQNTPLDTVSLVKLEGTRIVWMDGSLKINDYSDMEAPIRKLDQSGSEAVVFLGKVGLGISKEHLLALQTDCYDGIFLILDQEDVYTGETVILPETDALRIRFRGSHSEAGKQYLKLMSYVRENHMKITGFSREVTLIDYGITYDKDKFVTEICIPVKCE